MQSAVNWNPSYEVVYMSIWPCLLTLLESDILTVLFFIIAVQQVEPAESTFPKHPW